MSTSSPIVRKKESWLGVGLTALGCALFLVWWFWPGEDEQAARKRQATPENFLQAAQEARNADNSTALDAELLVLALQASVTGDDWLKQKVMESIGDGTMKDLIVRFDQPQSPVASETPESDVLDTLLEEGKVDAALAAAAALEDEAKTRAMLKVAGFLTQSGEIDRARALVTEQVTPLPTGDVNLQLQLAELHGQWGDFEGAETALKAAATAAATAAEQMEVAQQCYSLNLFDEGLRLMAQAEQSVAGDPALTRKLAEVYLQMGETEKARAFSDRSAQSENSGDAAHVLALELALAGWEATAFAKGLAEWRALESDEAKTRATGTVREYFTTVLAASEAPALIRHPVASGRAIDDEQLGALQTAVDDGQPELGAAAIETWQNAGDRSCGYVILARLLLWRHVRTPERAP
ncbi:MAG: hypothetical protein R3F19_31510 [Verrucomicrobiales bacterium]